MEACVGGGVGAGVVGACVGGAEAGVGVAAWSNLYSEFGAGPQGPPSLDFGSSSNQF